MSSARAVSDAADARVHGPDDEKRGDGLGNGVAHASSGTDIVTDEEPQVVNDGEDDLKGISKAGDEEASPEPAPTEPPNGGSRAWLVVLGCWCASFCSWGWINSK